MQKPGKIVLPSDRSFGLLFAVVGALVGAWMLWRGNRFANVAFGFAALFLVAALAYPRILRPLNIAWMHLGLLLNKVVSPIVMGVIYFGLFTPIAAVMRLRGRDVLQRKFDPARESYWINRDPPGPDGSSFPRQY
ncbi:MAG: SxtJ family membrane protein [Steroidobacteraceae bacterium]